MKAALHLGRLETLRPEEIRRYQIVGTILFVFVSAWFAIHQTLDPISSDRQRLLVNLEYHPIASFAGALFTTIILAPFAYWMFGRILRRRTAASKLTEHPTETVQSVAGIIRQHERWPLEDPEPKYFISSGVVLAVTGLLLLDNWLARVDFMYNILHAKVFGLPYRYVLLCSLASISWGLYRHWATGKKPKATIERLGITPQTLD